MTVSLSLRSWDRHDRKQNLFQPRLNPLLTSTWHCAYQTDWGLLDFTLTYLTNICIISPYHSKPCLKGASPYHWKQLDAVLEGSRPVLTEFHLDQLVEVAALEGSQPISLEAVLEGNQPISLEAILKESQPVSLEAILEGSQSLSLEAVFEGSQPMTRCAPSYTVFALCLSWWLIIKSALGKKALNAKIALGWTALTRCGDLVPTK